MKLLVPLVFLALMPLAPAAEDGVGTKVNRFQLVSRALKYPGLYRAAMDYMSSVSFPKNDVITCYWKASGDGKNITITNVLPGATRTIRFHHRRAREWDVAEVPDNFTRRFR